MAAPQIEDRFPLSVFRYPPAHVNKKAEPSEPPVTMDNVSFGERKAESAKRL
jgi:hypothetical protein